MKMKAILAGLVGLVVASSAQAAVITYTMNASGGTYSVTASVNSGDNFGLTSYTLTLSNTATRINAAPQATFTNATFTSFKSTGFILLRSADGENPVTGSQDTTTTGATMNYGIGQMAGTLATNPPSGTPVPVGVTQATYDAAVVLVTGTYTGDAPTITAADGRVFATNTGASVVVPTITINNGNVPEPASLAVLGLAGAGVLARRRRA